MPESNASVALAITAPDTVRRRRFYLTSCYRNGDLSKRWSIYIKEKIIFHIKMRFIFNFPIKVSTGRSLTKAACAYLWSKGSSGWTWGIAKIKVLLVQPPIALRRNYEVWFVFNEDDAQCQIQNRRSCGCQNQPLARSLFLQSKNHKKDRDCSPWPVVQTDPSPRKRSLFSSRGQISGFSSQRKSVEKVADIRHPTTPSGAFPLCESSAKPVGGILFAGGAFRFYHHRKPVKKDSGDSYRRPHGSPHNEITLFVTQ